MSDIISLSAKRDERSPSLEGPAKCVGCGHAWRAVAELGVQYLECPACHEMRGIYAYNVTSGVGQALWTCNICSGELFEIRSADVLCIRCGSAHQPWSV